MNTYTIIDESTDEIFGYVDADSLEEAEQLATERMAESGRDRELCYDGFYIL